MSKSVIIPHIDKEYALPFETPELEEQALAELKAYSSKNCPHCGESMRPYFRPSGGGTIQWFCPPCQAYTVVLANYRKLTNGELKERSAKVEATYARCHRALNQVRTERAQ